MQATTEDVENLLVIDSRVPQAELFPHGLAENTRLVRIDPSYDGLEQLAAATDNLSELNSIQIVAHGYAGGLQLGSSWLDVKSLEQSQPLLTQIGDSLNAAGDILLLACNVSRGDIGRRFIETFARGTRADIAASTGLIGSVAKGGNWTLETSTGHISAELAVSARTRSAFTSVLQTNVMEFRGNTSVMQTNGFPRMNSDATIEVWFKDDSSTTGIQTLVQGLPASSGYLELRVNFRLTLKGGKVNASLGSRSSYVTLETSDSFSDGLWHHAAFVWDSPNVLLYVDGVLEESASFSFSSGTRFDPVTTFLGIQASRTFSASNFYSGQMRDVRLWGRARTAAQILADKEATLTGAETNLNYWYTLDQGLGGATSTSSTAIVNSAGSGSATATNSSPTNFVAYAGTVSAARARLALTSRVSRVGAPNFSLEVSSRSDGAITYASDDTAVATVDTTTGEVTIVGAGTVTITATQAASSPYGADTATATVAVSATNTAPTVSGLNDLSVVEETESALRFPAGLTIADADGDVSTVTVSVSVGTLSTPVDVAGVTETLVSGGASVTLQGAPANLTSYLRTAGNLKYTGAINASGDSAATLSIRVNDSTIDSALANANINITNVNDAPVLDVSTASVLGTIAEDISSSSNVGTPIRDLVDGLVTDVDGDVAAGIALVEFDATNGDWLIAQLSPSATTVGSALLMASGGVIDYESNAYLVPATATSGKYWNIIFRPDPDFNGTATFKYRAWDGTAGTVYNRSDTTSNGGTTAFSTAMETVTVTVSAVNDAPTLTTPWGMAAFTEDTEGDMRLYFVRLADAEGDSLTLVGEVTTGTIVSVADGSGVGAGVTATKDSATQFTLSGSIVDLHDYMNDVNKIRYLPPVNRSGTSIGQLNMRVNDGSLYSSVESENIRVTAVNDAPVLDPAQVTLSRTLDRTVGAPDAYGSDNPGYSLSSVLPSAAVTDVDGSTGFLAVTEVDNRFGRWQYSTSYREETRYTRYYASGWRNFSSTVGSIVDLSTNSVLIRSTLIPIHVRYVPNPTTVGTATLKFRYADNTVSGSNGSIVNTSTNGGSTPYSTAVATISVRTTSAPEIDNLEDDVARFIVSGNAVPIDVGQNASVIDADSSRMTRLEQYITAGFQSGDEFDIDDSGADVDLASRTSGASVSIDSTVIGTLGFDLPRAREMRINLNASATPALTQKLLRHIVYRNTDSSSTVTADRTLRTRLTDADSGSVEVFSVVREAVGNLGGTVTASSALDEDGLTMLTSADSAEEAVSIFDFTIADDGVDGLPIDVSRIRIRLGGTINNTEKSELRYLVTGPGSYSKVASYGSGGIDDAGVYLSYAGISVPDGGSETYTLKVYRQPTKKIRDGVTIIPSVDGTDFIWQVDRSKTEIASTGSVGSGAGTTIRVDSAELRFTTLPSSVTSAATNTIVVKATDDGGGVDSDFTEDVTLTATGAGTLGGTTTVAAVAGVATFSDITYTAAVDGETFTLTADDEASGGDFAAVTTASIVADVVATKLLFSTQPSPTSIISSVNSDFDDSARVTVSAVGPGDVVDTDYTTSVVLESNGAGTTVLYRTGYYGSSLTSPTSAGVANAWPNLGIRYTNTGTANQTLNLTARSGSLTSATSTLLTSIVRDTTANFSAASGVTEPVTIPTTARTLATAVDVFDFTLNDGSVAGGDGLPLLVTGINVLAYGTSTDAERSKIRLVLNGPDVSSEVATYSSSSDRWGFGGGLPISIADQSSEVYTVSAYFPGPPTGLSSSSTLRFRVWRNTTDVGGSGTQMVSGSSLYSDSTGSTFGIDATRLAFLTEPAGSVSGAALTTQPVVAAVDASGNIDTSFTDTVTLTEASAGTLTGTTSVAAVNGVATFTDLVYSASADGEDFVLTANDQDDVGVDFAAVNSAAVTSDVVATKLEFSTLPSPMSVYSLTEMSFSTVPVVRAVDAEGLVDTDYTASVILSEAFGAGSAKIDATGDVSASDITASVAAVAGVVTYAGLKLTYTNAGSTDETFKLRANDGSGRFADSDSLTSLIPNLDATLTAGPAAEPAAFDSTRDTAAEALNVLDFTLADGGGDDDLGLNVTAININVAGTSTDAEREDVTWLLNGAGVTDAVGSYNAAADRIEFTGLGIALASGASATYTLSAYYNDNTSLTDKRVFALSLTGNSDVTFSGSFIGSATAVTNSALAVEVVATQLEFTREPAGTRVDIAFAAQPIVSAVDAFGNVDSDYTDTITLSESSPGALDGTTAVAAVGGVATFSGLAYKPLTDGEVFTISADDTALAPDLAAITATTITAEVKATTFVFVTDPPIPSTVSGQPWVFTSTMPLLHAVNADGVLDTDYSGNVTLLETGGAGNMLFIILDSLRGADRTSVTVPAVAGVVTFEGMTATYTNSIAADETFRLRANGVSAGAGTSELITSRYPDGDSTLTAASGVSEPVAIDTTVDTIGEAIDVFDFTLSDGPGGDGFGLAVSALNINVSGTSTDAERAQLSWRLNGPGVSAAVGAYDDTNDRIEFTGLGIDLASGGSGTYTLSAFYNDNTNLTEGKTLILSIDGDTDLTFIGSTIASSTPVTNGTGSRVAVEATELVFTAMPAGTTAGAPFTTQPIVTARDAFGNTDIDFTETITLSESSPGALGGDIDVAAVAGVATFTGVSHKPAADGESVTVSANDEDALSVGTRSDLPTISATALTSDVVATRLAFLEQPAPLNLVKARATELVRVPRVGAVNADGIVDSDHTGSVILSEVNGAGSAVMSVTGDTDGATSTVTLGLTAGVASFTDMEITYTNSGAANETFNLRAARDGGGLTSVDSAQMQGVVADTDADVTAAAGVVEPASLPTTATSAAAAVALFDFVLSDGATVDSLALLVNGIDIQVGGTSSDAERAQLTWLLTGPDLALTDAEAIGIYDAANDVVQFTGLSLSIASSDIEVYTLSAYFNDNTAIRDNVTLELSLDGDTDVTVDGAGTQFGSTTAIDNLGGGTVGAPLTVTASALSFATAPAGSASGAALTTQPVVHAMDAAGNIDTDFTETLTLAATASGSSVGSLAGDRDVAAVAGVARFVDVAYTATADKQSFALRVDDEASVGTDLPGATSASLRSEVTATRLAFAQQPNPHTFFIGEAVTFAPAVTLAAQDAAGVSDIDFAGTVVVSETGGPGRVTLTATGDTDTNERTVSLPLTAGELSLPDLRMVYEAATTGDETFMLRAETPGLAAVSSTLLSAQTPPPPPKKKKEIEEKIDGRGKTLVDPVIGEGGEIAGGKLCGSVISAGVIRDVDLCPGVVITGGIIAGEIRGDPEEPALLVDATVEPGTRISNVRVGVDVILLKGVIIGENVGFDSLINVPAGVMLSDTLEKIAVPGATGADSRIALDLRSRPLPGASMSSRTSYLELVNETPEFSDSGSRLEQAPTGELNMEFPTSESRMLPVAMRKTEDSDHGFYFNEDGYLTIRMGINLEIIMYPMFSDEAATKAEIDNYDSRFALSYDEDSNFVITRGRETGAQATEPRYVGRPGVSAFRAIRSRRLGFHFYPSPWLANRERVSLIYENERGQIMEQELVPTPRDWFALKERLLAEPEVSSIRLSSDGVISLGYRGELFEIVADYYTLPNAASASANRAIVFVEAGDRNGDGEMDYYSYYPNGDRQILFVRPK